VPDARIKAWIRQLLQGPHHACGYRKLTRLLRRKYRLIIDKKKVYRLCKELGVLLARRQIRQPVPRRIARSRVVTGPNQLWRMDIKYGYVAGLKRHFYMVSIIDVFDRQIVGYHVDKVCHTRHVLKAVQKALWKRNVQGQAHPPVIRTDNGPQFKSKETFEQAFAAVDRFIRFYNTERLHGSLKDLPPSEYLELVTAGMIQPQRITA